MPEVTFTPLGVSVQAAPGAQLMDVARQAGVALESECGGKGTCGSCMVLVEQGSVEGDSGSFLPFPAIEEGFVLACRSQVGQKDVTIRLAGATAAPAAEARKQVQGQFAAAEAGACEDVSPAVRRFTCSVPAPQPEDGLSDLDRLRRHLQEHASIAALRCPLPVLRTLAQALRQREGHVTLTWFEDPAQDQHQATLLHVAPGSPAGPLLGAAIDLGTTTISVQVVDLETGAVLATASDYNPQTACGLDVISRINYAQRAGGLSELRQRVLDGINALLRQAVKDAGAEAESLMLLSLAGNTVMSHLLLGLEPEYIRLAPYTPTVHQPEAYAAGELGLEAAPLAPVLVAPSVGSYVGGDIVAGLLCTPLARPEPGELRLFLDIGTNGEVALGDGDFLLTCACSAGPAFEGGGMGCGMRASGGAIEHVSVDPETGAPTLFVIGGGPPAGLCGSGAIDLLASLFSTGWLDAAGRFDRDRPSDSIRVQGKRAAYVLAPAAASATGEDILLTEADIDNLMRAKAAVYAGCALLLQQAGLDFADLVEVVVAGGFGRYLDVEAAVTIGLLPDLPRERFRFIGNASLAGAARTLASRRQWRLQAELASRLTYLELSTEPAYMDQYTAALFLPHTEASRFPSVLSGRGAKA